MGHMGWADGLGRLRLERSGLLQLRRKCLLRRRLGILRRPASVHGGGVRRSRPRRSRRTFPETKPAAEDWMSLGVFAMTSDGQPTGAEPTMFLQLAVSKQGIINGTFQNTATNCRSSDRRHGRQANAAQCLDGRRQVSPAYGNGHRQPDAGYNAGTDPFCRRLDPTMAAGADGRSRIHAETGPTTMMP